MTEHYSIVMARKPLSEKTIVDNVIKWGTGGINIDESRIGTEGGTKKSDIEKVGDVATNFTIGKQNIKNKVESIGEGRFPANIIFDEEAGKILDEQSGISKSGKSTGLTPTKARSSFNSSIEGINRIGHNDEGGASRFFYKPLTEQEYENQEINLNKAQIMNTVTLLKGDCLEKLKELKDNTIDAVVTDPPYEIGFMGKGWDDSGIANNPELWKEVLRVLKPGGHLLSFSHSRTYHRQAVAVEDAGFEIRDQIMWIYGSGFPKSHNIGKAVDKLQGNEREHIATIKKLHFSGDNLDTHEGWSRPSHRNPDGTAKTTMEITKGNSPYEGWGTALKPAHEPIVMARKPFKGSVAQNVLEWGTGGINIDESRVGTETIQQRQYDRTPEHGNQYGNGSKRESNGVITETQGRFPANIIFDEEAGKILDEQSGVSKSLGGTGKISLDSSVNLGGGNNYFNYGDTGGASRFFYCPKASKKDRDEGMEHLQSKSIKGRDEGQDKTSIAYKARPTERKNIHPTVKPTDLMAYLVRMVTPKGGTVLDPFMGSGSTGKAAVREGFNFIGIEREDEYMEIAKSRIEWEQKKHNHRKFFDE